MRTRPSRPEPSAFQRPTADALGLSAVSAEGGPSTRGCTSARPRCRSTEVSGRIREDPGSGEYPEHYTPSLPRSPNPSRKTFATPIFWPTMPRSVTDVTAFTAAVIGGVILLRRRRRGGPGVADPG